MAYPWMLQSLGMYAGGHRSYENSFPAAFSEESGVLQLWMGGSSDGGNPVCYVPAGHLDRLPQRAQRSDLSDSGSPAGPGEFALCAMALAQNGLENPTEAGRGPNPYSETVIFPPGTSGKSCILWFLDSILREYCTISLGYKFCPEQNRCCLKQMRYMP